MRSKLTRSRRFGIAALLALAAACPVFAQQKPVTIADVVAAAKKETVGDPIWNPISDSFAFTKGKEVWLYDIPSKKTSKLFHLEAIIKRARKPTDNADAFDWKNRRVAENVIEWFPSGKDLLVTAGGDFFIYHLSTQKFDSILNTDKIERDAKLSPDGKHLLYRLGPNLFLMDVKSRKARQLTSDGTATLLNGQLDWVYPEELDLRTATWWSPDSQKIAFLQFDISKELVYPHADLLGQRAKAEPQRYPQAGTPNASVKLGVIAIENGYTTWMKLGDATQSLIARVQWLPDSKRLAVQRLSRLQDRLDLLFTDAQTGNAQTVCSETSKTWVNLGDDLYFFRSRPEFLWSSEADGFRHLYRYSLNGKLINRLTRGEWPVNGLVSVDEANNTVFYTSAEESPLEQHLYRISLDGTQTERLTKTAGTHTIQASENGKYYLDTFSSLNDPPETTVHDDSGKQIAVYRPADRSQLERLDLQPTEIKQLRAEDGTLLYARLIKPAGFQKGLKYPAIVMVYGGPHAQAVRNTWPGVTWDQALAHRGYVIWQLDNRGTSGRGHGFESPIYRRLGKIELEDQKRGLEFLIQQGFVDPKRVGIYGWSYGGYMTLYSLLHAPDLFRAGIAGAPVTDWRYYDTIYTERYMGLPSQNEDGYKLSSNVHAAAQLKAKLMIVHNLEDDNVLFQHTLQMLNALQQAGKQFDLMLFPQKTHHVAGAARKTLLEGATAFFDRNLKQDYPASE